MRERGEVDFRDNSSQRRKHLIRPEANDYGPDKEKGCWISFFLTASVHHGRVGVGLHKSDTKQKTTVIETLFTYETACTHVLTHENRHFEKWGGGGVGREVR